MARNTDQDLRKPLQVPVMYAFREAYKAKDARKGELISNESGERVLSERGQVRRRGANEHQLKRNLEIDLSNLMNTIDLASVLDLSGADNVRKSVLNYGIGDMIHLTSEDNRLAKLVTGLKEALLNNEPRLVPGSLVVKKRGKFDDVNQKIAFDVEADMACRPVDIPLEFVAEIDVGSGKMKLSSSTG